ncbi:MAG: choice-of-anchor D domain-containing protein [Acidobacteria bacterium]|nr:choice-of-anchor D domain-containing protein [Acidobacteriota bacterium]
MVQVRLTGTYKLSRYYAGLLWLVMRDKATKQSLYMPWDFARNTAGKERDIIEQGSGRQTPLQFNYRLPAAAADLEFFLVMTPQDQATPTNYDRAPTVPFGETFAFSPVVSVSWTKPGDAAIDHIEVVQVVQNDKNEIPLIAGKNTVARVFLRTEPATADPIANLNVKLTSPNGGVARRLNGPITAEGKIDRDKLEHSVTFALPDDWIKEGELTLDAEIELPKGFTDTQTANNKKSEKVRFTETPFNDRRFTVAYVPFCYQPTPEAEKRCPEGDLSTLGSWFQLLYPLAEGRARYGRLGTKRPTMRFPVTSVSSSRIMAALNKYFRYYDEKRPGQIDQLVAWIPRITDQPARPDRRVPIGRANTQRSGGTGRVSFVQDTSTSDMTQVSVGGVVGGMGKSVLYSHMAVGHEVGHNYGLRHPATPDSCGSGDPETDWPKDAAGTLLPSTITEPGFDTAARKVKPSTLKDLMTYCGPPGENFWASPGHYQKLLAALQSGAPSATAKPRTQTESLRRAEGGTLALVGGSARSDGTSGTLDPVVRLASASTPDRSAPLGNHCLVFGNDNGTLGRHCFQLTFLDTDTENATDEERKVSEEYFSFQVLLPDGATRIDLVADGKAIASLKAGTAAPSVTITSPKPGDKWTGGGTQTLSWTATSADGGALTYAALYSSDGGDSWLPLDIDLTDTQIQIETAELEGGDKVFFRVVASAGFDSAETTVGPIELTQSPKLTTPAETVDFGHVLVGRDADTKFRIRSSGSGPVSISGIAAGGAAGMTVVDPLIAFSLASSESADVTVRFATMQPGVQTGFVTIESNDAATPSARVAVRARAVEAFIPEIALAPGAIDFGAVNLGQTRDANIAVRNVGSATLNVSSIAANNAAVTIAGPTRFSLEPGARRDVTLQFRPASAAALSASLTIASDDPDRSSTAVALNGRGVSPTAPSISVSPGALEFGPVAAGAARDLPLTISNAGTAELNITSFNISNARFAIVPATASLRVAAGAWQQITVRFSPAAAQAESGSLTIASNDPTRASLSVPLTGMGTSGPVSAPTLSAPVSVDFGAATVGQAKDATLTLRNTGSAALSITAITVGGAQFAVVGAPALPINIAAGGQLVLNLRMTAVAAGAQTGELRIVSNDPSRATTAIALTGTAASSTTTNPVPVLDTFTPSAIAAGGGAFSIAVTGSRFVNDSTVRWNGAARPTTFVSATQLTVAISASDIANAGAVEITVFNPSPGGGASSAKAFTIAGGSAGPSLVAQQFDLDSYPLVTAFVSPVDRLGNAITSLGSANFRCTEDGQPVNCQAETASGAGIGLSVAIVIDTSVVASELEIEKAAASTLIGQLDADDRVMFIQADATAQAVGGFTANRAGIGGALATMVNSGQGGTALYDAIEQAGRETASQLGRRRAVVVLTGSENSRGNLREAAALRASVRSSGVPVFSIPFGAAAASAITLPALQQLALETAGRIITASGNLGLQSERFGQILRNQHVVTWTTPSRDGAPHLFGVTLLSLQGTAATTNFYRGCRQN